MLSTNKGGKIKFGVIKVMDLILVPDSCRATERNGNSISSQVTDDTIEND